MNVHRDIDNRERELFAAVGIHEREDQETAAALFDGSLVLYRSLSGRAPGENEAAQIAHAVSSFLRSIVLVAGGGASS